MQREVRLYFTGRTTFDTHYFESNCPTDTANKAAAIASLNRADHYNFGVATEEEQPKDSYRRREPVAFKPSRGSTKEQVEAIQEVLGMNRERL